MIKVFSIIAAIILGLSFTGCTIAEKLKNEAERFGNISRDTPSAHADNTQHLNGWPFYQKEMYRNKLASARALAVNSKGIIFAALSVLTNEIVVLRSTDNGKNWYSMTEGFPKDSLEVIADLTINSRGHIFASTATHGVFRSKDNGETWSRVNTIPTGSPCFFAINSNVFIISLQNSGAFRSTDDGDSWVDITDKIINDGQRFYGDPLGVLRYLNKSIRFKNITNVDFSRDSYGRTALNSSGHIFIGSTSNLFRSMDHGETWKDIASSLREYKYETLFLSALTIDPRDNIYIWLGYSRSFGLFRSSDNGETWTKLFPSDK